MNNNSMKQNIEFIGLSYKKEMAKIVALNIVFIIMGLALYYFKIEMYFILIFVALAATIDFFYITRYSSIKAKIINDRDDEFISLLSYFEIFISNHNNVYKSFELLLPYSSEWMQENIKKLLEEIDHDKSVQPFINLGMKFKAIIIENVLISIYQMIDQGENITATSEFTILFNALSRSHQLERIQAKEHSFDLTTSFPLIGAAMLTVLITFCVISIIGEAINVI